MKKLVCICMAALMTLSTMVGCSPADTTSADNAGSAPTGKVGVNFEGTVTAVNGDEVTLESGKIIVITSDTGNFIQGYTEDDPDSERVSADKIYCNVAARIGGKLVINFEGKVAAVEDDRMTLENGQVVLISDDTVFSIASGVVEHIILSEGYNIQGYTEDDAAASEITASRIHIIALTTREPLQRNGSRSFQVFFKSQNPVLPERSLYTGVASPKPPETARICPVV